MESTGVYWKPIWNLLEARFELLLVNARHIKAVPGRKTDAKDCEWLADLLRHGLLRASFVPDRPQRELRELTRYRTSLVQERTAEVNRLQKTLEGANIKLGDVATDIMGLSSRQMLAALVGGETDAAAMAQLAQGRLRDKLPALERALAGRWVRTNGSCWPSNWPTSTSWTPASRRSAQRSPSDCALLRTAGTAGTIPGVGRRTAEMLMAEMGVDMSRFPTAAHLASWAGCARATTRVQASVGVARRAKVTPGCGRH